MSKYLILFLLFYISFGTVYTYCQPINDTSFDNWLKGEYMTGNWGGHREKLKEKGFIPFANFHASVLGNPIGGMSAGTEYAGQLIAGVKFDLEKIAKINGLSFIASGTWISGSSLSFEHIGNIFLFPMSLIYL